MNEIKDDDQSHSHGTGSPQDQPNTHRGDSNPKGQPYEPPGRRTHSTNLDAIASAQRELHKLQVAAAAACKQVQAVQTAFDSGVLQQDDSLERDLEHEMQHVSDLGLPAANNHRLHFGHSMSLLATAHERGASLTNLRHLLAEIHDIRSSLESLQAHEVTPVTNPHCVADQEVVNFLDEL